MIVYNSFYVGQSQTVAFYIMYVTGMFPIKLLKHLFKDSLAHSGPMILYFYDDVVLYHFRVHINLR